MVLGLITTLKATKLRIKCANPTCPGTVGNFLPRAAITRPNHAAFMLCRCESILPHSAQTRYVNNIILYTEPNVGKLSKYLHLLQAPNSCGFHSQSHVYYVFRSTHFFNIIDIFIIISFLYYIVIFT